MEDFTASNGTTVRLSHLQNGADILEVSAGGLDEMIVGVPRVQAVREFFQAEEDERLGRWRWPEDPSYVVYALEPDRVSVLWEPKGGTTAISRAELLTGQGSYPHDAARAYFDAHPEPKPWNDAKPGEVWIFKTADDRRHALGWVAKDGTWDVLDPRGVSITGVADPGVHLADSWDDEFECGTATRLIEDAS